jgi:hypothetical protein
MDERQEHSPVSKYQSLKEYWSDPIRNRRVKAGGRREADFAVCAFHESKEEQDRKSAEHICGRLKTLKSDIEKDLSQLKMEHESDKAAMEGRISSLDSRSIGKWPFGIFVILFGLIVGLISLNNNSMLKRILDDIDNLKEKVVVISTVINREGKDAISPK